MSDSEMRGPNGQRPYDSRFVPHAQRIGRAVERLLPSLAAVIIPNERDEPEVIGSGVFLRTGPSQFVITAAHVMDQARGKMHIGGESRIVSVAGHYSHTLPPDGSTSRAGDRFDLALVPLADREMEGLRDCRFLGVDELEPRELVDLRPVVGSKYLLLGYPCSKQRVRDGVPHLEPLRFVGRARPLSEYRVRGWDPRRHLLIEYDRKRAWNLAGRVTLPKPYGLSGGGLFRVRGWVGEEPEQETLVAIAIEYAGAAGKTVIGTRISVCLEGIAQRYPHLQPWLRRT